MSHDLAELANESRPPGNGIRTETETETETDEQILTRARKGLRRSRSRVWSLRIALLVRRCGWAHGN